MSNGTYAPGVYEKDGVERSAPSARDAVKLAFEGFKPRAEPDAFDEVDPTPTKKAESDNSWIDDFEDDESDPDDVPPSIPSPSAIFGN